MRALGTGILLALSALCFGPIGCVQFREADVPGTYTVKAGGVTSTIVLAKDHTFEQTVRLNGGEVKHLKGHWKLVGPVKNSVTYSITFIPFLNMQHDMEGAYAPAAYSSIAPGIVGGMNIALDPDWGIEFHKAQ